MPPIVPLQPLARGQIHVLRTRALIGWAIAAAVAAGVHILLLRLLELPLWLATLPVGAVAAVPALAGLWSALWAAPRRWRRWGYAFTGSELHVAHGWLVRVYTIVPTARVQHIDVLQGPIERRFGVATLALHTAGTDHARVLLPGIAAERAAELRDAIREQIRDVPW